MRVAIAVVLAALSGACGRGTEPAAEPTPSDRPPKAATPVDAAVATQKEPPVPDAAPPCLLKIEADHGDSVLEEQRGAGGPAAPDFFERYDSATIDPKKQQPLKATDAFRVSGQPILWLTADKKSVVVDERAFGPLSAVAAHRIGPPVVIGRATTAARDALPPRDLVRFLIAAGAIRIYAHIGGWVCLESEAAKAAHEGHGSWYGRFHGEHEYYTNEHNIDPIDFHVDIAQDGTITLGP